jgi:hypothetical protein
MEKRLQAQLKNGSYKTAGMPHSGDKTIDPDWKISQKTMVVPYVLAHVRFVTNQGDSTATLK